jgi:ribose transport system substrate-binding protein
MGLVAIGLAACGSSSESNTSGDTASGGGGVSLQELQAQADAAKESTYSPPPAESPKPEPNKEITGLVYGMEAPSGAAFAKGITNAGNAIGWNVNIVDGEFSTSKYLDSVRKAVAEGVDGIAVYVIDCPSFQAAAMEAKKADIPIIYAEGFDCNELEDGGPESGYSLGEFNLLSKSEHGPLSKYIVAAGELQGIAAAVANDGAMNSIVLNETDAYVTLGLTEGFLNVSNSCSDCSIEKEIDFVAGDLGPPLQEKVEQALLQAPDANTIFGNYDDPVISGAAAAVRAAGRIDDVYVTGAAGHEPMMELIRSGEADMTSAIAVEWYGWAAIDRLNRLFAGDTKPPATGIGLELVDRENNLPVKGEPWKPKVDYEGGYEKAWGVGR